MKTTFYNGLPKNIKCLDCEVPFTRHSPQQIRCSKCQHRYVLNKNAERRRLKYHADPEVRKKHRERMRQYIKIKYSEDKKFREKTKEQKVMRDKKPERKAQRKEYNHQYHITVKSLAPNSRVGRVKLETARDFHFKEV